MKIFQSLNLSFFTESFISYGSWWRLKGEMYRGKKYPLDKNLIHFLVEFTFIFPH